MTQSPDVPVIVVGAGPVGLTAAFFLACFGVRPLVLERRAATGQRPRANSSPRTVELFRSAGLSGVDDLGWEPANLFKVTYQETAFGPAISSGDQAPVYVRRLMSCTPSPRRVVTSDQWESRLLDEVRARGGEVRFGSEVIAVDVQDEQVNVIVADGDTGREWTIGAAYLIGADGANSAVRGELGITMPDLQAVGTVNTATFRTSVGDRYDRTSRFCFVRNDAVYAAITSVNGHDMWGAHIMDYPGKPGHPAELSDGQTIALLRAAFGDPALPIELIASVPWQARLGIASSFRTGRAFLAGDAAHVQTSAGGLGMNTGMQDAHNLAWKLAAVLSGSAAESILDSYESERRAAAEVSVEFSRGMTRSVGIGSQPKGEPDYLRDNAGAGWLHAMMFYRYDSAAIVAEDHATDLDVLEDDARPGYRMPHHWLLADGERISTVDLPGPHWLLLTGNAGEAWLTAAKSSRVDVRAFRVTADGDGPAALQDFGEDFLDVAGISSDGAVLIRPDGFVCWRTARAGSNPTSRLQDTMDRVLGPNPRR